MAKELKIMAGKLKNGKNNPGYDFRNEKCPIEEITGYSVNQEGAWDDGESVKMTHSKGSLFQTI